MAVTERVSVGRRRRRTVWFLLVLWGVSPQVLAKPPTVAFYYGMHPAVRELADFDLVVVDPDSDFAPVQYPRSRAHWIAYVSVGEVTPNRGYYDLFPKSWILGDDPNWNSEIIDQTSPAWPVYFAEQVVRPLWNRGYRGFFLDTLDSWRKVVTDPREQERQQAGLVRLIETLHRKFPQAQIILNRGFELLPRVHSLVNAVVVESVFQGWNQKDKTYYAVSAQDTRWLLSQIDAIRRQYRLPVIVLDYCDPQETDCAAQDISVLRRAGVIPYVSDGLLQIVNPATLR